MVNQCFTGCKYLELLNARSDLYMLLNRQYFKHVLGESFTDSGPGEIKSQFSIIR